MLNLPDYFHFLLTGVKKKEYRTDVIIVGVNAYSDNKDNDEKIIKKKIEQC